LEPLLLDEREAQVQGDRAYRIDLDDSYFVLRQKKDTDWKTQYRFTLKPYEYSDYAEMCLYHQTSPESHFTRARICSRATPEGRISISDMRFIVTDAGGRRQERPLASREEYATVLREQFGIVIPG
jgi:N-hydroxyarylamine O-acetyltransferase